MSDTIPLSIFLIARDEAERLPRTLAAAAALADQVVVVDSGSTDGTPEIARAHGAELHHRDWDGYGPQKRFAEGLCTHPWMLNIDADEVITPELAQEIRALLAQDPAPAAYRLRILNVYPGDARPRPLANDYDVVRFYHREAGSYRDHPLFDRVETTGPVKRLRGALHHFPFLSWQALVEKQNRYTSFQAAEARPKPHALLVARLLAEFPLVTLKMLVMRRHILGGWKGLAFSVVVGFARWLRIVKMLEAAEKRSG